MGERYDVLVPPLITFTTRKMNRSQPVYTVITESLLNASSTPTSPSVTEVIDPTNIEWPHSLVILVPTALLTLGCILGNLLVILAVLQVHKLRTPSNYLIMSLALSDLLVGLVVMPLAIKYELLGVWVLGQTACSMWVTLDVTLSTSSILNLMMISIDRYLIITRPFKYSQKRTIKLMIVYIAIAWISSLAISILPLIVGWSPELGENRNWCQVSQKLGYQMYATVGAFYLPLMIMIAMYGKIYFISRKFIKADAKQNPKPAGNNNDDSHHSSEVSSEKLPLNGMHKDSVATVPEHTITADSNVVLPIDHNVASQTIIEDDQQTDISHHSEAHHHDPHHDHHQRHHGSHHHHHHFHFLGDNLHGEHRHGSWPLKKLSVATIASVKKLLTRRSHKGNTQAIRTLGVIMGLFTLCWLPFFMLAFISPICGDHCDVPKWVWGFLTWLGYANSCFNPIIYARFNREFRTPFKEILCCRCHKINESVRHTEYLYQYGEPTPSSHHHG